jgi:hypothetical protein
MAISFGSVRHIDGSRIPLGYQQILSGTLASATTLTVPATAQLALVQCEGVSGTDYVRWRDDGANPTATVGMMLGAPFQLTFVGDLATIVFIAGSGASPILNVSYYH